MPQRIGSPTEIVVGLVALLTCMQTVAAQTVAAQTSAAQTSATQTSQDDDARASFEAGRQAFAQGDYEWALLSFERSYQISKKPQLLYNIAITLDRLRRDPRAIETYEAYVQALPAADNRAQVERRVRFLRDNLGAAGERGEGAALQPRETDLGAAPMASKADSNAQGPAPSPEEVARDYQAADDAEPTSTSPRPASPSTATESTAGRVHTRWWLWTGLGVLVAAGVVTALLAADDPGDGGSLSTGAIEL